MRVIGTYYSRISLARLAELLCLPAHDTEKHLSDLVTAKKAWGGGAGGIIISAQLSPFSHLNLSRCVPHEAPLKVSPRYMYPPLWHSS